MSQAMKQAGARNIGCTIELMEWSNKVDLLAYSTEKGEVVIQRLNWQKIVTFPRVGEDVKVRSLSWQLDGTMLAAGYSNGRVAMLDAEREDIVSGLSFEGDISKLYFSRKIEVKDYRKLYRNQAPSSHDIFLPPLPPLSGISAPAKASHEFKYFPKTSPCFLVVIMKNGVVHLLLLSALKTGTLDLKHYVNHKHNFEVMDVRFNCDFNCIYCLVRDGKELKVLHFQNKVLEKHLSPLLHIAEQCANVLETKSYMYDTIQCIFEAWETVVLEMDNKLTKFANSQPEGSLSADLLELLVFGYATHEIEEFLMEDLTEKGVKKIATSVGLSFNTVLGLVAKPLLNAGVNIFYFLSHVKGMARLLFYFDQLLSEDAAVEALRACGSFLLKVIEMQQIIHHSLNEMKLFFTWLCSVIVLLHQHDPSENVSQVKPEDIIYLADYLNKFEDKVVVNEDGSVTKRKFNLEKVGQYLENKNLQQPAKRDVDDMWDKLLEENDCLRKCKLLCPHDKHTSLIQERDKLVSTLEVLFDKPNETVSCHFDLDATLLCAVLEPQSDDFNYLKNSFIVNEKAHTDIFLTTVSANELLLMEFERAFGSMQSVRIQLPAMPINISCDYHNLHVLDFSFYKESTISLLLENRKNEKDQVFFAQLGIEDTMKEAAVQHQMPQVLQFACNTTTQSIFRLIDPATTLKEVDDSSRQLAVSGKRKLLSILSDHGRKMTIYEMEVDDEEDDTEISHTSQFDSSANLSQN